MPVNGNIRFNLKFEYPKEEVKANFATYERIHTERILALPDTMNLKELYGKRVVFVGDSITSDNIGYRLTVTRAARLRATDTSLSGGKTNNIKEDAKQAILTEKPDIVSIMIGANDSPIKGEPLKHGVALPQYAENLREIVAAAAEVGAKILLLEITPIHEANFAAHYEGKQKFQTNANIEEYNVAVRGIAAEFGATLLQNGWLGAAEDFEKDGIHLSDSAQARLARRWLETAIKLI
ncbi:MAG: hypothetical protein IKC75_07605 [Clostridia bacterium]|nr:hypothetical protein [Clostridia bacterium]